MSIGNTLVEIESKIAHGEIDYSICEILEAISTLRAITIECTRPILIKKALTLMARAAKLLEAAADYGAENEC